MLTGKTALITGGSSGIGLAAARRLAADGARVAITGADEAKLAAALGDLGPRALAIRADVRSLADLKAMAATLEESFGTIDIVFANAGVAYGTPIAATGEEAFDRMMDINVKGVFFTIQSVLPIMADGGSIILNTSWLNKVGTAGRSVLSASKAAMRKIRVNCVSPGPIDTPIHHSAAQTEEEYKAYTEKVGARVPAGRMGRPEEIAAAVAFLASEESSFMLGTEMIIDGGLAEL